jgi:hypothetical protein
VETILLSVPLTADDDGTNLVAEVDLVDLGGTELVADDGGGRLAKAGTTLSEAFEKLEPALEMIVSRLRHATRHPDEITVDFGLKVGGETGLVFAKGTAEANLSVSVKWRHDAGPEVGQVNNASGIA